MDFAQHVKSSVDIVSVIGDHVRLRKQGPDRYIALCPFHTEKTPSFSVHHGLQIYKCFGCGKGGDVFTFLMELQGLSFFEALTMLAERHGIPMPKRGSGELSDAESRRRAALYHMHEIAQSFFQQQLRSQQGARVRAYLEQRGLSEKVIAEFGLGFAPSGNPLTARFEREGIPAEHLEASGLVAKSRQGTGFYDRFRDRLTFPIANETGKIVAFAGRAILPDQQPKYLNSAETPIYRKSSVLYNLHRAKPHMRRQNRAVLVEGYMDVIGADSAGFQAVVATCGTALTPQQVRALRRHVELVVVNFDPDPAGQGATQRSIQLLLEEGLGVRVLTLPGGLDPADYCQKHGPEAYRERLDHAPDYYLWLADRARQQFDLSTTEGRIAAFRFLMPAINLQRDKIKRASLADELASHLGIEPGLVLEQFRRAAIERRAAPVAAPSLEELSAGEKLLVKLLMRSAEARQEMLAGVAGVTKSEKLASAPIFEAILAVQSAGEPFQYAAVEGRLGEKDRERLSRLVFGDDAGVHSLQDGRSAYSALRLRSWERRYRALRRSIQEAEKSGDRREALRLLKTKSELENERHKINAPLEAAAKTS